MEDNDLEFNSDTVDYSDELHDIQKSISELSSQVEQIFEYIEHENDPEPLSEEELEAEKETQAAARQYDRDVLDTLHSIDQNLVSGNSMMESLQNDLSAYMTDETSVSENTVEVPFNEIITTKLENYSLTDQLLVLIIILLVFALVLSQVFRKRM